MLILQHATKAYSASFLIIRSLGIVIWFIVYHIARTNIIYDARRSPCIASKKALHICSHVVLGFADRCHYSWDPRRSSVRRVIKRPAGVWIAPPHYSVALPRRAALNRAAGPHPFPPLTPPLPVGPALADLSPDACRPPSLSRHSVSRPTALGVLCFSPSWLFDIKRVRRGAESWWCCSDSDSDSGLVVGSDSDSDSGFDVTLSSSVQTINRYN